MSAPVVNAWQRVTADFTDEQRDAFAAFVEQMEPSGCTDLERLEALRVTFWLHRDPSITPQPAAR
jgi:hypothetical protein